MATIISMASTAKKSVKQSAKKAAKAAVVVSMATIAYQTAMADMKAEYGDGFAPMVDEAELVYRWDPTDGFSA